MRENSELMVITKARDLAGYVFAISENAPKKFRFSLIAKMQNSTLEILESLILANEVHPGESPQANQRRREYQQHAIAKLKSLDAVALIAREQSCILPKQYETLTRYIHDCIHLTGAWISSDKRRSGIGL